MKIVLVILITLIRLTGISQTQREMNQIALDAYKKTEKELNDVYNKILIEYKSDTLFIKNLNASQKIWITFRDAELRMKYPEDRYNRSIGQMCESIYLEMLTKERIEKLTVWLTGIEEGDVCIGSVKYK